MDEFEEFYEVIELSEGHECEYCGWNEDMLTVQCDENGWNIRHSVGCYGGFEFEGTMEEVVNRLDEFSRSDLYMLKSKKLQRELKDLISGMFEWANEVGYIGRG